MSDFEKLINASDLIEWIMETYPDWCEGAVRSIVDHISELPSAQPARKKGKWVEDDEQIHVELTYHCSECGFQAWGEHEKTDYCGICGAEMERKDEQEG